ncbi:MAG: TolC family protein [Deltaproteobacteria bacterium]|jgi:NodT family efflux transporter outer membrane factor (OMF) lipoprotein|nr:TolC family protein [Deltaproteobacteria bacterium]
MPKIKQVTVKPVSQNRNRIRFCSPVWIPLLLLAPLFISCTTLGPDFKTPSASVEEKWNETADPQIKAEAADYSTWWHVLNDPVLDNLITMACKQNLSLRVAGLRILEARAILGIAVGLQYPQAQSLSGGYAYQKSSKNAPPLSELPDTIRDQADTSADVFQAGFNAAWELDFWGKFRRGVEAADAGLAASIASYDTLLVLLTAEVSGAYVVIRTLEQRLEFAKSNVKIQERGLRIAEVLFKGGETSELDVQQARSLLHNTQSTIPVLEISVRQAQNGLCVLLGIPPSDLSKRLKGPGTIPGAPSEVAVGIPADLLRRRPDIRLAEFQAAAQGALIGVAEADLYPHFAIGGSIGFAVGNSNGLFNGDSLVGFFTPFSFRWDIFNYGRIKNNVRVQDARFEQLLVTYQNKVLEAAREVENGLIGFIRTQQQEKYLDDAARAADRATKIALLQYKEGLTDYTRVLNTQQLLVAQQDTLASSRGDIIRYLIAVYKSLGGGWESRAGKDIVPAETLDTMRKRTDWGDLLGTISLPAEMEQPPTGKEVELFNKPMW